VSGKATPFDALLGITLSRLPAAPRTTVVISGQVVTDVRQIAEAMGCGDPLANGEPDDRAALEVRQAAAEVRKLKQAAVHKTWVQRNPERMAEKKREWREKQGKEELARRYREWYAKAKLQVQARRRVRKAELKAGQP
jgi:hypothetical protein